MARMELVWIVVTGCGVVWCGSEYGRAAAEAVVRGGQVMRVPRWVGV